MIRDPSDGSVREKPNLQEKLTGSVVKQSLTPDTGLRQPTRTDAQERLDKSRDWIRNYHARKAASHDGAGNGTELQAAGHSVEDVREAESVASA